MGEFFIVYEKFVYGIFFMYLFVSGEVVEFEFFCVIFVVDGYDIILGMFLCVV